MATKNPTAKRSRPSTRKYTPKKPAPLPPPIVAFDPNVTDAADALDQSHFATGSQRTPAELTSLRSQFATLKGGRGRHRKYLPYAFTEHGAIMAATILNSPRAVEMSVYVVRAFVHLRELLSSNRELARRFAQLETRLDKKITEHDVAIAAILSAIRELMHPPPPEQRPIGFTANLDEKPQCQD